MKVIFENFKNDYIDYIYDIENQSIDEGWTKEQLRELIGRSDVIARVGILQGEVVCSYSLYIVASEGFVNNLSVKESVRGKGVGSLLIEDMINSARDNKVSALTLEVNENNEIAINLYNKYGFVVEGKRPNFYKGKETALIMWKRDL